MIIDNDNNNDNKNQARHMDATVYMCARNKLGFYAEIQGIFDTVHHFLQQTLHGILHACFLNNELCCKF